jgi:hypothetical protein
MVNDTTIAIVAIVAAMGLLGLLVTETMNMPQQAFARGCGNGTNPFFKSRGHCFYS